LFDRISSPYPAIATHVALFFFSLHKPTQAACRAETE
jgi:hypothetical protein